MFTLVGCDGYLVNGFRMALDTFSVPGQTRILFWSGESGGNVGLSYNPNFTGGVWHHCAVTYDGSNAKMYVDGELVASQANAIINMGTEHVRIGGGIGGKGALFGEMDEIRVYKSALSLEQVRRIISDDKLTLHLQFDEDNGSVTADSSGSGNHGLFPSSGGVQRGTGFHWNGVTGTGASGASGVTVDNTFHKVLPWDSIFTLSLWVKVGATTAGERYALVSSVVPGHSSFSLSVDHAQNGSGRRFRLFTTNASSSSVLLRSTADLIVGRWYHLAVTYDGSANSLHVDGETDGDPTYATMDLGAGDIEIAGGAAMGGNSYLGSVDEVRVHRAALPIDDIRSIYKEDALVLNWKFESEIDPYIDYSGAGNDGVPNGSTLPWTPSGFFGGAIFNVSEPYIYGWITALNAQQEVLPIAQGPFSLTMWIKPGEMNPNNAYAIAQNEAYLERGFRLAIGSYAYWPPRSFRFWSTESGGNVALHSYELETGQWYHLAAVYDGAKASMYVNGELVDDQTGAIINNGSEHLHFGLIGGLSAFTGTLDEVRIYQRALDAAEVAALVTRDLTFDSDFDALPDYWERLWFGADVNPAGDSDGDGITDLQEFQLGTSPTIADSDGDGMPDGFELQHGFQPLSAGDGGADADGDGVSNSSEYADGTNPASRDTDGDGLEDGHEQELGTDPTEVDTDGDDSDDVTDLYPTDPRRSRDVPSISYPAINVTEDFDHPVQKIALSRSGNSLGFLAEDEASYIGGSWNAGSRMLEYYAKDEVKNITGVDASGKLAGNIEVYENEMLVSYAFHGKYQGGISKTKGSSQFITAGGEVVIGIEADYEESHLGAFRHLARNFVESGARYPSASYADLYYWWSNGRFDDIFLLSYSGNMKYAVFRPPGDSIPFPENGVWLEPPLLPAATGFHHGGTWAPKTNPNLSVLCVADNGYIGGKIGASFVYGHYSAPRPILEAIPEQYRQQIQFTGIRDISANGMLLASGKVLEGPEGVWVDRTIIIKPGGEVISGELMEGTPSPSKISDTLVLASITGEDAHVLLPVDVDVIHPAKGELSDNQEDVGDGGYVSVRRMVDGEDVTPVTKLVVRAVRGAQSNWKTRLKFSPGDRYKIYSDAERTQEVTSEQTVFDATQDTTLYFQGLKKSTSRGGEEIKMQINVGSNPWSDGDSLKCTVVQSEFQIQVKAFIPYAWTEAEAGTPLMGGKVAKGDNLDGSRGFKNLYSDRQNNYNQASFRLMQKVTLTPYEELHPQGDRQNERKAEAAFLSEHYSKAASVAASEQSQTYGYIPLTGSSTDSGEAEINLEEYKDLRRQNKESKVVIRVKGEDGALPWWTLDFPHDIEWHLHLKVRVKDDPLMPAVEVNGKHDRYPAYEVIIINSQGQFEDVHRHSPLATDHPGTTSLDDDNAVDVKKEVIVND